jgi:hypothetical protein
MMRLTSVDMLPRLYETYAAGTRTESDVFMFSAADSEF